MTTTETQKLDRLLRDALRARAARLALDPASIITDAGRYHSSGAGRLAASAGLPPLRPKGTVAMSRPSDTPSYTREARRAIAAAVRHHHDFAEWLAALPASVAAEQGSAYSLVERRPGSWEASLVLQLVQGTVGYDDEYLAGYLPHDS